MGLACSRREKQREHEDKGHASTLAAGSATIAPPPGLVSRGKAMPPRCKTDGCDRLRNVSSNYCCTVCARGDAARLGHTRPCEYRVERIWSVYKDPQLAGSK